MRAATVVALLDKLRLRKHNIRSAFGHGAPAQQALIALGKYTHAYENEVTNHDGAMVLLGLRRAYFFIIDHLEFEPDELAQLYKLTKLTGDE